MDNIKSSITILTCHGKGKRAAKKFIKNEDESVTKDNGSFPKYYEHDEKHVANIYDIAAIVEDIACDPRKLIIRGKIKENMKEVVQRKTHEPNAAFEEVARPYVMLDIDKLYCPNFYDASVDPESLVKWAIATLPKAFLNVTCFYKFSSSQDVPNEKGEIHKDKVSLHLWFWCDRAILSDEWKRYFRPTDAQVDLNIFSPVQMHYTANPLFENMDDPLQKRSGIVKGEKDYVTIWDIPEPQARKSISRIDNEPIVTSENRQKALNFLLPYYQKGSRHMLCGAVAATLYRKGWKAENAAYFVLELAEMAADEEISLRFQCAMDICNSVDEGQNAYGVPTLRDEFDISQLDKILGLLGIGKPNIDILINKLSKNPSIEKLNEIIELIISCPAIEHSYYIDKIKSACRASTPTLRNLLKEAKKKLNPNNSLDAADITMELFLEEKYQNGNTLIYGDDSRYWRYNEKNWDVVSVEYIESELLPYARKVIKQYERLSLDSLRSSVMRLLKGRVYRIDNPFKLESLEAAAVINCNNGELWFDADGSYKLKPHKTESYLRYCLNVDFNPSAKSPKFDKAVIEIFKNSSNPKDMFRHFMELIGYICQPWRHIPIIVLLHGGGSNGKSSLMKIVMNILGEKRVVASRINDINKSEFKIGHLDGKLMLIDDDMDCDVCLADGLLKQISEEKIKTGEHKFGHPFQFVSRAVPVMLSNDYPAIKDLSYGMFRRMKVIPFKQRFEGDQKKVGLFDEIWNSEASGILNHIVEGFSRLRAREDFDDPEDSIIAKNEWFSRSNALLTFIEEECEIKIDHKQILQVFYDKFRVYCEMTGARYIPSRQRVAKRLEHLGYGITKVKGEMMLNGIRAQS